MNCPICHNEMRDLRPKSNAKAPDFVCDTENCGKLVKGTWRQTAHWLAAAPTAPQGSQKPVGTPKWTWMTLAKTYERALLTAEMRVTASADRLGTKATVSDVLQATATIFIEACRSGVSEPVIKLPPKPEPQIEEENEPAY